MKTIDDLREFYNTTLVPDLQVLEKERKKIVNKLLISGIIIAAVALVIIAVLFRSVETPPLFMFTLFIGGGIWAVIYYLSTRDYVTEFKSKVIQRLVTFVDENLKYSKNGCIPMSSFLACQIFKRHPDRYRGDDLVSGKVGATQLEFSEIHAEYKTEHTDSKGHRRTQWHTIFKGLFFIADFNKSFKSKTVVLPDTAERIFGHLGQLFQSWNVMRGQLIKLEDPEFEKEFAVYGDDQVEARYILSTSLMKRIMDFKRKAKKPLHLSFVGSKIYVAITYRKNLFEPRVFQTLLDFKPVQEYFEDLIVAVGLVEDLNLNIRIWSKE